MCPSAYSHELARLFDQWLANKEIDLFLSHWAFAYLHADTMASRNCLFRITVTLDSGRFEQPRFVSPQFVIGGFPPPPLPIPLPSRSLRADAILFRDMDWYGGLDFWHKSSWSEILFYPLSRNRTCGIFLFQGIKRKRARVLCWS